MSATIAAARSQQPLPEGWVEGFDSKYNRKFYFHKPTKHSSWSRPTNDVSSSFLDPNQSSMSAQLSQVSIQSTPKTRTTSTRVQAVGLDSPLSSSSHKTLKQIPKQPQQDLAPSPVPARKKKSSHLQPVAKFDVWLEVYSEQHQRNFFFNKVTRESVWVDPRTPAVPAVKPAVVPVAESTEVFPASRDSWERVGVAPVITQQQQPVSPRMRIIDSSNISGAALPSAPAVVFLQPNPATTSPIQPTSSAPASHTRGRFEHEEDQLGNELRQFARNLEQEKDLINLHSSKLDFKAKAELDKLGEDTNELTRTAEAMANSKPKPTLLGKMSSSFTGSSSSHHPPSALANWGVEPPKVIEVKRAMKDVENGIKYAKEELKAHGEAAAEAKLVDSEGGYYTILGVSPDCDTSTMKKAFRKAMVKAHPDKVAPEEKEKAQELAGMLQNAFACLSDEWERYLYDYFGLKRYLQNAKVIQCFKNYLLSGIEIIKHPRKGYPRRRFFWISPDFEWLMTGRERILEPSKDEMDQIKGVRIADIHDISRGITTEVLERTGKNKKQSRYFSIITNERTLDLEAESKERADFLMSRISLLVLDTQKNKKWLQRFFELKALRDAAEARNSGFSFRNSGATPPPPPTQT
ncbi:hypothetical protein BASA81_003859 [Batrachochytrium salamandrivorans]|nr:hypothetical protein BASA81_003859 [Batrachochytrium salamandrivorans]